ARPLGAGFPARPLGAGFPARPLGAGFPVWAGISLLGVGCAQDVRDSPHAVPNHAAVVAPADPFDSPLQWYPAPGWTFSYARPLPNLGADGEPGAVVMVCDVADVCRTLLVSGPLDRSLTLPGDEAATLTHALAAPTTVGDATGDGVPDLEVPDVYGPNVLVEGPFAGAIDVSAARAWGGYLLDLDGDGILDLTSHGAPGGVPEPRLEVRYGPSSRWSGAPDLVVEPSCGGELPVDDWTVDPPLVWPDVTGDGVRELYLGGYAGAEDCSLWVIPIPDRSVSAIDPATDSTVQRAWMSDYLYPIADQTGDGVTDFLQFTGGVSDPGALWAGPLTVLGTGEAVGTANLGALPANLWDIQPMSFDLNGDGIGDFVARSFGATVIVYGGVDGLTGGALGQQWSGAGTLSTFSSGTEGWMLVSRSTSVALVDLGAVSAPRP
ncbi:MAG: hypothetical protein ABMB14_20790, partial [Myxococcota bacterium]